MTTDIDYMKLLIAEAEKNLASNNFPVAAGLVVDGEMIGLLSNRLIEHSNWMSHAEIQVLQQHSSAIRERTKKLTDNPGQYTLYSTLESCLMCLGAAALSRISRIVYACPDPRGGATNVDPQQLGSFYHDKWPIIEQGPMLQESYDLIIQYYQAQPEPFWPEIQKTFEVGIADYRAKLSNLNG